MAPKKVEGYIFNLAETNSKQKYLKESGTFFLFAVCELRGLL